MVKVICGIHLIEIDAEGKTVAEIREALKEQLNIPESAIACLGGEKIDKNKTAKNDDLIDFMHISGEIK